jgi:hypothetical protein
MDLAVFMRANVGMPAQKAAMFAAEMAERLAELHADRWVLGSLEAGVRVESAEGRPRPVIVAPGRPDGWTGWAEDVRGVGVLLVRLLGAPIVAGQSVPPRPATVPERLWDVVVGCLSGDPHSRPTAAVLARQLRDTTRDLLLGVTAMTAPATRPAELSPPSAPSARAPSAPEFRLADAAPPDYVPAPSADQSRQADIAPRRRGRVLAAIAAAVVLAVGAAAVVVLGSSRARGGVRSPPATAPTRSRVPPIEVCLPSDCAAKVTFRPNGDQLVVCDTKEDSLSAAAFYTRADVSGERAVWATEGKGTCVTDSLHMPEGVKITFKVCTGDRPTNRIARCTDPVTGTT